ncbi:MAG: ferredoxin [Gemmatimonadota bacterium]
MASGDAGGTVESEGKLVRVTGGLRLQIDRHLCVGFGDCVDEAPEAFGLDGEGLAVFRAPERASRASLLRACEVCPVDAIEVECLGSDESVP